MTLDELCTLDAVSYLTRRDELPEVDSIRRFLAFYRQIKKLQALANTSWDVKYDIIFDNIMPNIRQTGINVEWVDPDTSYEEDCLAYIRALDGLAVGFLS